MTYLQLEKQCLQDGHQFIKKVSSLWFEQDRSCHALIQIFSVVTHYLQIIDDLAANQNHPRTFYFIFGHAVWGISVPSPGMEPGPQQ